MDIGKVDFKIKAIDPADSLSNLALSYELTTFKQLCSFVKSLPYSRISDSSNLSLVLKENKGTCSTKHGFVKAVAMEQNQPQIKLFLAIFKMNNANTPGIGGYITDSGLDYLPEAHCFLDCNEQVLDLTKAARSPLLSKEDILVQIEILPHQVGNFKVAFHKKYLREWGISTNSKLTEDELWRIRELCIESLSKIDD